jgi:hypothetical protein
MHHAARTGLLKKLKAIAKNVKKQKSLSIVPLFVAILVSRA